MTLDSTFLNKIASSKEEWPEDDTTRVPDNEVLAGPANSRVVVVPVGFRKTPTSKPTPTEFLAYCDNGKRELNQRILPVAYHNGAWFRIVPTKTGLYRKEPRPSIATFNTYDLEETLKGPSPIRTPSPEPRASEEEDESEEGSARDSDTESLSYEDDTEQQIRNSPVVTVPLVYSRLPPTTMASTSTTTQTQVAAQGAAPAQAATPQVPAPNPSTPAQIAAIFH